MLSTAFLWLSLALVVVTTGISVGIGRWALKEAQKRAPRNKVTDLELAIAEHEHAIEKLTASFKKLNARTAMATAREIAKEQRDTTTTSDTSQRNNETAAQWKARMREQFNFTPSGPVPKQR